jgi:HK97 family phage major capsid protein
LDESGEGLTESVADRADIPGRSRAPVSGSPDRLRGLDAGQRTVERVLGDGRLSSRAADSIDDCLRARDPHGLTGRYLAAAGSAAYGEAFAKLLTYGPQTAFARMTDAEREAVRVVSEVESERAPLAAGVGSTGGFAIPITIDPSVTLTSSGVLNPVRQVASVIQTSSLLWRGVTSAGVTMEWPGEAGEAADLSPTLAQPEIKAERGDVFVPFSFEVGQDWASMEAELAQMTADARDVGESAVFFNGVAASNQPVGILATTGGLTTSERVQTAGAGAYAYADVYSVKQALGARFQGNASWLFHPTNLDRTWQLVAAGDTSDAPIFSEDGSRLLRKPWYEWSALASTVTTGSKIGVYGDFSSYRIVDRLGTSVEIVQNLFGANRRPTGQRGYFAFFRVGAKLLHNSGLRYLEAL